MKQNPVAAVLALLLLSVLPALGRKHKDEGVHNGRDTSVNVARNGWFNCYNGGKFVKQAEIKGLIDQACGTKAHNGDTQHFSFAGSGGSWLHQELWHYVCDESASSCDRNSAVDDIFFTADIKDATRADTDTCTYAMTRIAEICWGDNEDTRGGYFVFDGDGTSYGFDPAEKW